MGVPRHPLPPDELGHRLMAVFDVVGPLYRRVLRAVEQAAPIEGVSVGVRAVLDLLRRGGPMTVPQMCAAQGLSRQFVQRMVNDALARGDVVRQPNPAHRRSVLLALSTQGIRTIDAVTAREHALLRQVRGGLTEGDVECCLRVLRAMLAVFADVDLDGPVQSGRPSRSASSVTVRA